MFTNNLLLRSDQHGDIKLGETSDWRFAAHEMLVPVVFTEMADIAREYPLLFIKDKPGLFALTGIEQGINAYVADDGHWQANYIPALLRAYPLALAPVPQKAGEFALVLDGDAPQVLDENGFYLFREGQPTPFLNKRMALLEAMKKAEPATHRMVEVVRSAGLLIDRAIRIQRQDGEKSQLTGLQVVDESKLNAIGHEEFAILRDQGVLPLIYAHLLSMVNLRQGALAGKYPHLASQSGGDSDALEAFYTSDTIRFN